MATDLKPCPFCGWPANVCRSKMGQYLPTFWLECSGCGTTTRQLLGPDAAISSWESRTGDHDEQEEEAAQEADREPEEETGEVEGKDLRLAEEFHRIDKGEGE